MVSDALRAVAPAPRIPEHDKLGRLVARSLGLEPSALQVGLHPALLADLPDITALRREHLRLSHEWDDSAYLRWRYRLGRSSGGFGELWCLRAGSRLVAIIGVEDLRAELDGQALAGAQVMDLLVRPDAQESGLGIWLNQAMLARHDFTLAVGANQNSSGIVRRMFEPLAPRLTFTHPLDLGPFVRRRWPALARVPLALRAGNAGLALWRLVLRRRAPRDLALRSATQLDPRQPVPALPAPSRVNLHCDSAYLQQRLLHNPRRQLVLREARRGNVVVGLIAWSMELDDGGRPELHVIDWHHDREDTLLGLLHEALREAASQHCSCVRLTLQDSETQRIAARAGFMPSRDDEGRLCGVQSRDPSLAARLAKARWGLTDVSDDSDGF
jgi:hypothetical protein